jgi:hypothetical protein
MNFYYIYTRHILININFVKLTFTSYFGPCSHEVDKFIYWNERFTSLYTKLYPPNKFLYHQYNLLLSIYKLTEKADHPVKMHGRSHEFTARERFLISLFEAALKWIKFQNTGRFEFSSRKPYTVISHHLLSVIVHFPFEMKSSTMHHLCNN